MAGVILSITILATGSILPNAYADVTISNWTLTLENTINERTMEFTQSGTGLPDCSSGGESMECFMTSPTGQLKKCVPRFSPSIVFFNAPTDGTGVTVPCNGPWELTFTSDPYSCHHGICSVTIVF